MVEARKEGQKRNEGKMEGRSDEGMWYIFIPLVNAPRQRGFHTE